MEDGIYRREERFLGGSQQAADGDHRVQAGLAHGPDGARWKEAATRELITLLRDDYPTLMSVLGALGEVL